MAREVQILLLCDQCLAIGDRVDGEELTITLGDIGTKPRALVLCERHRKEFYDPLRDLVAEHGAANQDLLRPPKRRSPAIPSPAGHVPNAAGNYGGNYPGEFKCPACDRRPYRYKSSLREHAKKVHGKTLSELEGSPTAATFDCDAPECGRSFDSAQGLALHATRTHGGG